MKNVILLLALTSCLFGCNNVHRNERVSLQLEHEKTPAIKSSDTLDRLFENKPEYLADQFDFPIGKPDAKGYYNAQKFKENNHLGDDWNGIGGGNTDLGDPIFSIANGYVDFAENIGGGWGNVIRILHKHDSMWYESVYAHCDTITVLKGTYLRRGMQIGTIGNADGIYKAHLHLEIRDRIRMDIGGGYSENTDGFLDPTEFIETH